MMPCLPRAQVERAATELGKERASACARPCASAVAAWLRAASGRPPAWSEVVWLPATGTARCAALGPQRCSLENIAMFNDVSTRMSAACRAQLLPCLPNPWTSRASAFTRESAHVFMYSVRTSMRCVQLGRDDLAHGRAFGAGRQAAKRRETRDLAASPRRCSVQHARLPPRTRRSDQTICSANCAAKAVRAGHPTQFCLQLRHADLVEIEDMPTRHSAASSALSACPQ